MSCTLPVFACIEDVHQVISLLSEGQHGGKVDEHEGRIERVTRISLMKMLCLLIFGVDKFDISVDRTSMC